MLRFGVASLGLRHIVGEFGDWITNTFPPWEAYKALMLGHLIGLDKCPGARPVGVEDTWRQMLAMFVLVVTGAEDKEACGMEQIYGGLEAGIEGGIHAVQFIWK